MLPNFIIIGTKKAATTSLYQYVHQHPDVYMSPLKETRYFSYDETNAGHMYASERAFPVRTLEQYENLFAGAGGIKAVGEASPDYLQSPIAAGRIFNTLGSIPLIVSLRSPVDRAYSIYLMNRRDGREGRALMDAFQPEEWWVRGALYYEDLKRYYETFGRDRLLVLLFEEIRDDPVGTMNRVFVHIGVDQEFVPDVATRHNEGGVPRSVMLQGLIHWTVVNPKAKKLIEACIPRGLVQTLKRVRRKNLKKAPELSADERARIVDFYLEDIGRTEDLIGRDLSLWKDGG